MRRRQAGIQGGGALRPSVARAAWVCTPRDVNQSSRYAIGARKPVVELEEKLGAREAEAAAGCRQQQRRCVCPFRAGQAGAERACSDQQL